MREQTGSLSAPVTLSFFSRIKLSLSPHISFERLIYSLTHPFARCLHDALMSDFRFPSLLSDSFSCIHVCEREREPPSLSLSPFLSFARAYVQSSADGDDDDHDDDVNDESREKERERDPNLSSKMGRREREKQMIRRGKRITKGSKYCIHLHTHSRTDELLSLHELPD